MSTALACPRCHAELPADAFYGPCHACRTGLNIAADRDLARRLAVVADAVAAGWSCDRTRNTWARLEPCAQCDSVGYTDNRRCEPCKGTGEIEALVEWGA